MIRKKDIPSEYLTVLDTVRHNIKTVSEIRGLSLRETANAADIDWSTFNDFMTGKTFNPSSVTIIKAAFALNLTVSEIYSPSLLLNAQVLAAD